MTKIVIFTSHYPYAPGEEYLVDEINHISGTFDQVIIITSERNISNTIRNIPQNVTFQVVNRNYYKFQSIISGLMNLIRIKTISELMFANKILGYRLNFSIIKMMLIYEIVSSRLIKWIYTNLNRNEKVVLYSYWLASSAYCFYKLKIKGYNYYTMSRAHGYDAFLDRGYLPYRREIYKSLDKIIFISDRARVSFEEKLSPHVTGKRAKLTTFHLGTTNDENLKNPAYDDTDQFTIVSCSNIYPLKRLDIIINALSEILDYRIKWIHFGDGESKASIIELCHLKLAHGNVSYVFKGFVSNEIIKDFYCTNHVDFFINTSDYEGIPVSIMEAISYGIPIIARNTGGISEIVIDNYNGFLLDKEIDYKDLRQLLLTIVNLPSKKIAFLRENAYKLWKENYDANINYKKFTSDIKESIIKGNKNDQ